MIHNTHLLMIHINKEELDLKPVTSKFIKVKDSRIPTFWLPISHLTIETL